MLDVELVDRLEKLRDLGVIHLLILSLLFALD